MGERLRCINTFAHLRQNGIVCIINKNLVVLAICTLMIVLSGFVFHNTTESAEAPVQHYELRGPYFAEENISDCISPKQRGEIEQKITEYRARTHAATSTQVEPQPYSFYPQAGNLWQDLFLNNFVDIDPSSGILDWDCSQYTYDGHRGYDSEIRSFREQEIGVPVFAVLDGTVVEAHDGEFDRNTTASNVPANYVILHHGNGHFTWYYHLKRNSVSVRTNQFVRAGMQIGLTASSGSSTWPHLHFESQYAGQAYEPSAGLCRAGASNWVQQTPIRRELYVQDFSITNTNFDPSTDIPFDTNPRAGSFLLGIKDLYFRVQLGSLPANSTYRVRFKRPDNTTSIDFSSTLGSHPFFRRSWLLYHFIPNLDMTGTWHILFEMNGQMLSEAPFQVVASESEIINHPPLAVAVTFDPPVPAATDVIFCRVGTSLVLEDPDYDIVSYRYQWSINGSVVRDVTSAALSDAIPRGTAQFGDIVTCTVTPFDGAAFGPVATATMRLGFSCSYSLSSTSQPFTFSGGSSSVSVTADSWCSWNAASNVDWIDITSGSNGIGDGIVNYSVEPNTSNSSRTGTMVIAGQTFMVEQARSTPIITSVTPEGKKHLNIFGENFESGAKILLNGTEQKTTFQSNTRLFGKKLAKKIKKLPAGQPALLQVRNPDGTLSPEFTYTP